MATYAMISLYAFIEIFIIMYIANEITVESDRLSYCLFESNWIDQPEYTKKCVIILGEMMKIPQQLAVFIYPMNLEKFTSVSRAPRNERFTFLIETFFFKIRSPMALTVCLTF